MQEDTYLKIKLEALITEREGMVAENMQREQLGESMAYGHDQFIALQKEMYGLVRG